MKNIVNLQNDFLPGDLESQIASFVEYYNNQRYPESLDNLTPYVNNLMDTRYEHLAFIK